MVSITNAKYAPPLVLHDVVVQPGETRDLPVHTKKERPQKMRQTKLPYKFQLPPVVSPSVDPRIIDAPKDFESDPDLTTMRATLAAAQDAARKMLAAANAIHTDATKTQAAQHLAAKAAVAKLHEPFWNRFSTTFDSVNARIQKLKAACRAPTTPPDAVSRIEHDAIRRALASMQPDQRRAAINLAIESGDDRVTGAVLSMPAFVSGIAQAEFDLISTRWAQKHKADELRMIATLEKANDRFWGARNALDAFRVKLWDEAQATLAEESARKVREATA